MSKRRQEQLADLIQRELSYIINRKVKDPRLEGVTVTGIRVSADYQFVDVYVYRLGGDPADLQEALQGLDSAHGFIRRELGSLLTIRYTPDLQFHLDESIDYGDHIEALLTQIRQEGQENDEGGKESGSADS